MKENKPRKKVKKVKCWSWLCPQEDENEERWESTNSTWVKRNLEKFGTKIHKATLHIDL